MHFTEQIEHLSLIAQILFETLHILICKHSNLSSLKLLIWELDGKIFSDFKRCCKCSNFKYTSTTELLNHCLCMNLTLSNKTSSVINYITTILYTTE